MKQLSWPTIAALIVSSIIVPWLASKGFDLTNAQQAQFALWLSGAGIAFAGLFTHVVHAKMTAAKQAQIIRFAPLVLLLPLITGCAAYHKFINNGGTQLIIGDVVGVGITLVLAANPEDALPVQEAAKAIAGLTGGMSNVNITNFEELADAAITKQKLKPQVAAELTQVVGLIATGLAIGSNALPADASFTINLVFTDIAKTASTFTHVSTRARTMKLIR